ncbi:MAG: metallophosphoesterase [Patescibacteria group bacterium]|nr:metallophosphoesterase [Patescibacteria group bacterium]
MKIFLTIIFYSFYLLFPLIVFLSWQLYKNKKRPIEIIILLILAIFLIWMRFVELNNLIVKDYKFTKNKGYNNEIKVAVFSDMHLGVYNNDSIIKKIVQKIKKINPDVVIIPGDFIYFIDKNKLVEQFSDLKNISVPVLAVLGNHDYGKPEKNISQDLNSVLESLGIIMIDNQVKKININGDLIEFIGTEDIWVGNPDYEVLRKDGSEDQVDFTFFITHNPDTLYEVKDLAIDDYKKIDLMIAGHTHAGQIRLPILYKHIIPTKYNFDKGFYNISNLNLFITPGIGTVGLPLRLFNFPELSILNIRY